MLSTYLSLPRAVHLLCLGTFINRAGTLIVPFLTIYLRRRLGLSEEFATLALGAYGLGSVFAGVVGGHLADTIGRRRVMLLALVGSAALLVVLSFVTHRWLFVAGVLAFAAVGDMYRPAAAALIADLVDPARRPHAFGLMYVSINLGFAVGPVIGGMMSIYSFRLLFWADAGTSAAYALLILLTIRETLAMRVTGRPAPSTGPPEAEPAFSAPPPEPIVPLRQAAAHIARNGPFLCFAGATLLLGMGYMQGMSILPLYLEQFGIGPDRYGRIIALNGLLIVLFQLPIAAVVARCHRGRVMVLAAVVTGAGFGLKMFADSGPLFAATVVIWTLGEMLGSPTTPAIVSDLAPAAMRARYFGVINMCFAGANMLGAPIGGVVLHRLGGRVLWAGVFGVGLLAALLFAAVRRQLAARPAEPTAPDANP